MKTLIEILSFQFDLLHINTYGGFRLLFCVFNTTPLSMDHSVFDLQILLREPGKIKRWRTSLSFFGITILRKITT